jgi:hypothetical protein
MQTSSPFLPLVCLDYSERWETGTNLKVIQSRSPSLSQPGHLLLLLP